MNKRWRGLMVPRFKCGHEKVEWNIYAAGKYSRCKLCQDVRTALWRKKRGMKPRRKLVIDLWVVDDILRMGVRGNKGKSGLRSLANSPKGRPRGKKAHDELDEGYPENSRDEMSDIRR